jgi:phage/plasmid-associated DNA primase
MDARLLELLRKTTTEEGGVSTHITTYGPNKKWCVKDNEYPLFWQTYCELVQDDPSGNYCLAEQPTTYMPVIADLTLKFHPLDSSETYSYNFVLAVVYCYQQAILAILNVSDSCEELICCILEADDYVEDNLVISRFRIQFPYCKTLASVQNRLLRPYVLKSLRTENVKSRLNNEPINEWETIIDPCTAEQPCVMYGSSPCENIPKYELEYIFFKIERDNIDTGNAQVIELEEAFYPWNHELVQNGLIHTGLFNDKQDNDFWLPMFFSVSYFTRMTTPIKSTSNELTSSRNFATSGSSSRSSSQGRVNSLSSTIADDTKEIMAERFLAMLGPHRIESNHFWNDVGKALYNTHNGGERGLELWTQFTQRIPSKDFEECEYAYPEFSTENNLTYKTLAWYAREDSPDQFNQWHTEWYGPSLEKSVSCDHADIAEALYRVYFLEFMASTSSHCKGVYVFENHVWKKLDNGHNLRVNISGDFLSKFEKLRTSISVKINDSVDSNYKESAEVLIKKIGNLIGKLKSRPFKQNVLMEALEKFYIENLDGKLDSNTDLLGMRNCVIESNNDEAIPRPGKPEDFVSKSTGINWKSDLHWNHPIVEKLMDWLRKVFPDTSLLDYFGKISGSCIKGRNSEKLFPILTGDGDNSKSMIKKLFEATFGPYSVTFPTTLFTAKQSAGGPTPETAQAKAARVAWLQEPDSDDSIKNGMLKQQTGGDSYFTRGCNENGGMMVSTYKLFLMCNHVPIIPNSDGAVKKRVRILPFLSKWVIDPPTTTEEQFKLRLFKIDPHFERVIPRLAPAFMWYMVQMFGRYRKEGLDEPQIIKDHTAGYWIENDIYEQFRQEKITSAYVHVPNLPKGENGPIDENVKITEGDLYKTFTEWFRTNYSSLRLPDRPLFLAEIASRLKAKPFKRAFRGIKYSIDVCADQNEHNEQMANI